MGRSNKGRGGGRGKSGKKNATKASTSNTKFILCPTSGRKVIIEKLTLKDLKQLGKSASKKGGFQKLYILPSYQQRQDLYLDAATAVCEVEQCILPSYGQRTWSVQCSFTESSCKNTTQVLFRSFRGRLELATLPHLIEKIPAPPNWPGTRRRATEEWEETEEYEDDNNSSLQDREVSTLSTVAWEHRNQYPVPSVAVKWLSPDHKSFMSRKAAWEHVGVLCERDVLLHKHLKGVGASGKKLNPFVPSAPTALKIGKLRFERDGLWVVGQELAWQAEREEELEEEELERQQQEAEAALEAGDDGGENAENVDEADDKKPAARKPSALALFLADKRVTYQNEQKEKLINITLRQAETALRQIWKKMSKTEQAPWVDRAKGPTDQADGDEKGDENNDAKPDKVATVGGEQSENQANSLGSPPEESQLPENVEIKPKWTPMKYYVRTCRHAYREQRSADRNPASNNGKIIRKCSLTLSEAETELREIWKTLTEFQKAVWKNRMDKAILSGKIDEEIDAKAIGQQQNFNFNVWTPLTYFLHCRRDEHYQERKAALELAQSKVKEESDKSRYRTRHQTKKEVFTIDDAVAELTEQWNSYTKEQRSVYRDRMLQAIEEEEGSVGIDETDNQESSLSESKTSTEEGVKDEPQEFAKEPEPSDSAIAESKSIGADSGVNNSKETLLSIPISTMTKVPECGDKIPESSVHPAIGNTYDAAEKAKEDLSSNVGVVGTKNNGSGPESKLPPSVEKVSPGIVSVLNSSDATDEEKKDDENVMQKQDCNPDDAVDKRPDRQGTPDQKLPLESMVDDPPGTITTGGSENDTPCDTAIVPPSQVAANLPGMVTSSKTNGTTADGEVARAEVGVQPVLQNEQGLQQAPLQSQQDASKPVNLTTLQEVTPSKPKARRRSTKKRDYQSRRWCLSEEQIALCHEACMEHYDLVMRTVKARDLYRELQDGFDLFRERGRGRFDMELPAFETERFDFLTDLQKAPWMPVVRSILGENVVLIHKGCFLSQPGAAIQNYHQDGVHLTKQTQRPCHAINVFVPLIDLTKNSGPTEFCLGSHILGNEDYDRDFIETPVVSAGTPIIFDYRLGHRGMGNLSRSFRPIAYCTYARVDDGIKVFKDSVNFSRRRYRKLELVQKAMSRDERSQKRRQTLEERKEQLQMKQATENAPPAEEAITSVPANSLSSPPTEEPKADPQNKKRQASTLEMKSSKIPKNSTAASNGLPEDVGISSTASVSAGTVPPVAATNASASAPVEKGALHEAAIKMTLQAHSVQSESPTTIQAGPGCNIG